MSKRIALRSIAVLGLLAGSAAYADDTGFYVGAGIGQSMLEVDRTTFDESDTAFKVFAGYSINRYFAVEGTYFDAGEPGITGLEVGIKGLNFSAVGKVPVGEQFAFFGKLGYAFYDWTITSNVASLRADDSESDLSYGLGGAFNIGENFELRAEYEGVDVSNGDFTMWTISGAFKF